MGRRTQKQNPQKIVGQSLDNLVFMLCVFSAPKHHVAQKSHRTSVIQVLLAGLCCVIRASEHFVIVSGLIVVRGGQGCKGVEVFTIFSFSLVRKRAEHGFGEYGFKTELSEAE